MFPRPVQGDTNYNGYSFNPVVTGTLTPTVTFGMPGTYSVALRITDSNGVSDIAVSQVTAAYVGPTVAAGADQTVNEGGTLSFSGSATDPDGTVNASSAAWDFNYNGSTFNPQTTGTLTPTHQFTTPGSYVVAFQATDNHGFSSLSTLNVTVNDVAPTVSVYGYSSATVGQLTPFSASASGPAGSSNTFTYAWDYNYNGVTLNPGSDTSASPQHAFGAPGTYVVAVQVTDSTGATALATTTVTVTASSPLVVYAGPDQSTGQTGSVTFAGSATDSAGTPDPTTADWDFNYNGSFVAVPSDHGTLTPTQVFNTPGVYLVALRLSDNNGNTSIGTMYATVADVAPTDSAGPDQTVAEGSALSFAGTASDVGGSSDIANIAWDFNYNGATVNPQSTGTLTPTTTYTAPGTYEVALQVTDAFGAVSLSTALVTVTDVAPTATVTNSGAVEEVPVTFTVSNVHDLDPNDTVTYLADWTGSGQFQLLTPDQLTTHQNGSVSFTHAYDVGGTYNAVVELVDGSGGVTGYTTAVTVTDAPPTIGSFGPAVYGNYVTSTTPFTFSGVTDASHAQAADPFTYYVKVGNGAYTSSSSPTSTPLANFSTPGSYTVSGYVVDEEGQASAVVSTAVYLMPPGYQPPSSPVVLNYNDTSGSQFTVTWTGNANPVTLSGSGSYTTTSASGLTITLLTSNDSYTLTTNGAFDLVQAAAGVTNVTLSVNTATNSYGFPGTPVGDGHVGVIDLPGGTSGSTVSVDARGDLTSIVGPSGGSSVTHAKASGLLFANLDGSITGLDSIQYVMATGWLGTSASQQVLVNGGIGQLTAYGVGATVYADLRQDAGDLALMLNVGLGGVTSVFDAGAVSTATITGAFNVLAARQILGGFTAAAAGGLLDFFAAPPAAGPPALKTGDAKLLLFTGAGPYKYSSITGGNLQLVLADSSLTVTGDFDAQDVGFVGVAGDFNPGKLITASLGNLVVTGAVNTNSINVFSDIGGVTVGGDLSASNISSLVGNVGRVTVGTPGKNADLNATVYAGGNVQGIVVHGNFTPSVKTAVEFDFVKARGTIGYIQADKTIGQAGSGADIEAQSIGTISAGDDITLFKIQSDNGDIRAVSGVNVTLTQSITAIGGDVRLVTASKISGNIIAVAKVTPGPVPAAVGGNIWLVQSTNALTNKITADGYIGAINVIGLTGVATKAQITAQGGAKFNPVTGAATPQALVVDVGTDPFEGSVDFTFNPRVSSVLSYLASFANTAPLFTLIDKTHAGPAGQTWKVNGPAAGSANIQDVLFTWLAGVAKPGLQPTQDFTQNGSAVTGWSVQ